MRDRVALYCMMASTVLICVFWGLSPCRAAKLTDSQIQAIQADIHNSTDFSTKCLELYNNAEQNYTMATTNYQKTIVQGFRQAAALYAEARCKSLETRKLFDDAWIQMQYGMDNGDLTQVQRGTDLHNNAVQHYNEVVQLLNKAAGILNQAVQETQGRSAPNTIVSNGRGRTLPTGMASNWSIPDFPPAGIPQNGFPTAALIILIATFITSFRAFKDKVLYERYILHPWSIVRYKTRYCTLITSGLIHADPMHLAINLMSFSFFALPLEGIIGHFRFILVYFGSLIFSSIIVTMKNGNNAYYRCLGASGAVSGVIFSYIIYRPKAQISMMIAPMGVPAPIFALAYVGYSYFMSKSKHDNVAHDAHLWGAIAGALITVVLDPNLVGVATHFLK